MRIIFGAGFCCALLLCLVASASAQSRGETASYIASKFVSCGMFAEGKAEYKVGFDPGRHCRVVFIVESKSNVRYPEHTTSSYSLSLDTVKRLPSYQDGNALAFNCGYGNDCVRITHTDHLDPGQSVPGKAFYAFSVPVCNRDTQERLVRALRHFAKVCRGKELF